MHARLQQAGICLCVKDFNNGQTKEMRGERRSVRHHFAKLILIGLYACNDFPDGSLLNMVLFR